MAPYESSTLTIKIRLTQGTHYVLKNKNRIYKPQISKDNWSEGSEIEIEPLLCSDNTDPSLSAVCYSPNTQAKIVVASGNSFSIDFGNKLTLRNLIIDFVDSLSTISLTNPPSAEQCYDTSGQITSTCKSNIKSSLICPTVSPHNIFQM